MVGLQPLSASSLKLGICRITVFVFRERKYWVLKDSNLMGRGKMGTSGWNTGADEFKLESR